MVLLVAGAVLLLVGGIVALVGTWIVDTSPTPTEMYEQGRADAARALVLLFVGAGCGWLGFRGLAGAGTRWLITRLATVSGCALVAAALYGLWLVAAAALVLVLVCVIGRHSVGMRST